MNNTSLIQIIGLQFSYYPDAEIDNWSLHVKDFSVDGGALYIVTGNNMSGKSTFLNILAGAQPLGTQMVPMFVHGRRIKNLEKLTAISTFLSNNDNMFPEFCIWDNIRIALPRSDRKTESKQRTECATFLERSDIFAGRSLDERLGDLSTGGRALVQLCRAHVAGTPVVIIDELTSYLDDTRAIFFLDRILELTEDGVAVLIASHSERDRAYLRDRACNQKKDVREISIVRRSNISELIYGAQ